MYSLRADESMVRVTSETDTFYVYHIKKNANVVTPLIVISIAAELIVPPVICYSANYWL